jgi:hypothetical protein
MDAYGVQEIVSSRAGTNSLATTNRSLIREQIAFKQSSRFVTLGR